MLGIVAFSYGLRDQEPSPCNMRLGDEVKRLYDELTASGEDVCVVAQWEVALRLKQLGTPVALKVDNTISGRYFDSLDVWKTAMRFFDDHQVIKVLPVAQPFVHLPLLRWRYLDKSKFNIIRKPINRIGHDKLSKQWWTRSSSRLLLYVLLRPLLRHGR